MSFPTFWQRFATWWRGLLGLVSDVQQPEDPKQVYEDAINAMVVRYTSLKTASATILHRRDALSERLTTERQSLALVTADIHSAVDSNQDERALQLLGRQGRLETALEGLAVELQEAQVDADEALAAVQEVRTDIRQLQAEKDQMLVKMSSAQAQLRLHTQLENLGPEAERLRAVRHRIDDAVYEAGINTETRRTDPDRRIADLDRETGESSARSRLMALKAARKKSDIKEV